MIIKKTTKQVIIFVGTVKVSRNFLVFVHFKFKNLHTCPFSLLILLRFLFDIFFIIKCIFVRKNLHSNQNNGFLWMRDVYFWNIWTDWNVFSFRFVKRWLWGEPCVHLPYKLLHYKSTLSILFWKTLLALSTWSYNWWDEWRIQITITGRALWGAIDDSNKKENMCY